MAFGYDNSKLDESLCPWARYGSKVDAMELKVGDKVLIKTEEQLIKEFGKDVYMTCGHPLGFNQEMAKFCGQTVTVKRISHGSTDYPHILRMFEVDYSWVKDMFDLSSANVVTEKVHDVLRGM